MLFLEVLEFFEGAVEGAFEAGGVALEGEEGVGVVGVVIEGASEDRRGGKRGGKGVESGLIGWALGVAGAAREVTLVFSQGAAVGFFDFALGLGIGEVEELGFDLAGALKLPGEETEAGGEERFHWAVGLEVGEEFL